MTTPLEWARHYAREGWCPAPHKFGEKHPAIHWKDPPPPNDPYPYSIAAALDLYVWRADEEGERGVGILTGQRSGGLIALDFDTPKAWAWFRELCAQHTILGLPPATLTATTTRGRHFYFKTSERFRTLGNVCVEGLDLRAEGGFIRTHQWDMHPSMARVLALPPWLAAQLPRSDASTSDPWGTEKKKTFLFSLTQGSSVGAVAPIAVLPSAELDRALGLPTVENRTHFARARLRHLTRDGRVDDRGDYLAGRMPLREVRKPGRRNRTFLDAQAMGFFVAAGWIAEDEVRAELLRACDANGLERSRAEAAISDGLDLAVRKIA